uniref:Uncharacterized protein n=1 Tax=Panagrolaimus sp. ES5 TaxID=591445 RepID=A0AC34GSR4_9BILA
MKTLYYHIFILSLFTIVNASTTVMASGMEAPEGAFWLTTELIGVTFTPGCLTTKYCVKPTFKVIQTLLNVPETPTMSWPINENLTKDGREHTFVTYWTSGEPKYVSFNVEIVGKDPTFAFSRVCDQSPETKVFQPDNAYLRQALALRARRHLGNDHKKVPAQVDDSPIEFTLVGQCFNATFAVRKHLERCPWCPDHNLHVSLTNAVEPENENIDMASFMANNGLLYSIIILIASFIITVTGIIICVCIYCCKRKTLKRTKSDRSIVNRTLYHQRALPPNHFHPTMHQTLLKNRQNYDDDEHHYTMPMVPSETMEHRYETPWDRKYRPVQQYWNPSSVSHKSEMTVTSPVESSSALGSISTDRTTIGGGNSGGSLPGVSHYHSGSFINGAAHGMINSDGTVRMSSNFQNTSPISANTHCSRHDDSGHDSV